MNPQIGCKMPHILGVSVREKQHGVFYVYVRRGSERCNFKGGTEQKANRYADEIRKELRLGQFQFPKRNKLGSPTVKDYWACFLREYVEISCRPASQKSYKNSFGKHIIPEIGSRQLHELTHGTSRRLARALAEKKLSKDSIRIVFANLSAMLNFAIKDGIITKNVAAMVSDLYKEAPTRHEDIEPLTAEEVPVFLTSAAQWSPQYFCLFLCAIHTGMREGEVAGLQWSDIDWNGKFAAVRRKVYDGKVGELKTKRSKRRVDLSDLLIAELKKHRAKLQRDFGDLPEWVFPNQFGAPLDMHNVVARHFYRALDKAEIRRIRFHDLRHTFASLLLQQGESLKYVADQLGHSSIRITADTYGHLIPGANRQAVNKLPGIEGPKDTEALKIMRHPMASGGNRKNRRPASD